MPKDIDEYLMLAVFSTRTRSRILINGYPLTYPPAGQSLLGP